MEPTFLIAILSLVLGAIIIFAVFSNYFRKTRSEIDSLANNKEIADSKPASKPQHKKFNSKPHSHAADKDLNKRHHPLDLNTLKGHADSVNGLSFSSDGRSLATACSDGVIRVFKLDDVSSKSFKFLRINLPPGGHPTAVVFGGDVSSYIVACEALVGSSLYMYGEEQPKPSADSKQQAKLPLPEIKWQQHKVHDKRAIITLSRTSATYGSADGSTIIASCSKVVDMATTFHPVDDMLSCHVSGNVAGHAEMSTAHANGYIELESSVRNLWCMPRIRTDIILWHGKTGKILGNVDTNQLKNTMAAISPNGRFIAAAAFTADVKVWEIVYSKDGSVKEVSRVMQLKGHKSAVTWLCFSPNSEQIITSSKDGTMRVWNINVRYHLDEDPKTLKVFPIPLQDSNGTTLNYDRLSISPDGRILAVTHSPLLQWLCAETGKILDTAAKAHDGDITDLAWAPCGIPMGDKKIMVLATSGTDKKVKLWATPSHSPS